MNVQKAITILKDKGFKYTTKREDLLSLFAKNNGYLTARQVLETLKPDYPGLSFDTIYRNLYLFEELDILETTELNGEKMFRLSCGTNEHHHHFICLDCGKTVALHACPMPSIEAKEHLDKFEITGHKFEIYGKCNHCIEHPVSS
ncbi:Fur family transcriptional regulator [Aureibacillus halotolerans]|uniref:Fur family zinc uptake regulator n=1 Tax=Aureibacillus halotolerans TaxID=1508390 RepID=A0A4R6TS17_9BACI|nr:Fur family transcriptional regulator [Aureibacillus halotolerans]TDQ36398.1 Fur family zinc uptake regulator [Aureibacillus halotolerans]